MYFEQITTPGLGCFSYLIGCPLAGVMAVVDPKRDIEVYLERADSHGMRVTHIFDTHVHADHISGARELSRATGADIYIHESVPAGYTVKKLRHNDSFTFGAARIRVLHTPGHTPNSVSLLVTDTARSEEPQMILTGDLLFVGDTGRPDLPGEEILQEQIRNLFDSLYKTLGELPDGLEVYPAHGQGSLCGSGMSAKPHSTLGYERAANSRLQFKDFEAFSRSILGHLPMRPQSFSHIIATNLSGPPLIPLCEGKKPALNVADVLKLQAEGAVVLDLRETMTFACAHIPGSYHVDANQPQAPNWIGAAVPPKARLILLLDKDDDFDDRRTMLRRIGYDDVEGWLQGGISAWIAAGRETGSIRARSATDLKPLLAGEERPYILDVRTAQEYAQQNIPEARHLPFDELLSADLCSCKGDAEYLVVCQTGYRAAIAAALLRAGGRRNVSFLAGGMNAYKALEERTA